jgi:hypothetical protein
MWHEKYWLFLRIASLCAGVNNNQRLKQTKTLKVISLKKLLTFYHILSFYNSTTQLNFMTTFPLYNLTDMTFAYLIPSGNIEKKVLSQSHWRKELFLEVEKSLEHIAWITRYLMGLLAAFGWQHGSVHLCINIGVHTECALLGKDEIYVWRRLAGRV